MGKTVEKRIEELKQQLACGDAAVQESSKWTENEAGGGEILARGYKVIAEKLMQIVEEQSSKPKSSGMTAYKFTVNAVRERFMESPLRETLEYLVAADSFEQARDDVYERLMRGGWKVEKMSSDKGFVIDIRA